MTAHEQDDRRVKFTYQENGAKDIRANFDFYPTIAALVDGPIPEHCDGVDLFPYLKGERTGEMTGHVPLHKKADYLT